VKISAGELSFRFIHVRNTSGVLAQDCLEAVFAWRQDANEDCRKRQRQECRQPQEHNAADDGTLFRASLLVGGLGASALRFKGGFDIMELASSADINTGTITEKSISQWFHPTDVTGRKVLYQQGGTVRGMNIYIQNGRVYAGAWNDAVGWDGTWLFSTNVTENAWNHVTLTYDSIVGEIKLHLNGGAALTGAASALGGHHRATLGGVKEGSRYKFAAGFINSTNRYSYFGVIDDVRIYDRVLSDAETAQFAANVPESPQLDLVAYWDFEGDATDEALEGSVSDDSTLTGGSIVSSGAGNSVLEFHGGSDVLEVGSSKDINTGNITEKSISLWFKPTNVSGRQVLYQQGGTARGLNINIENGSIYAGGWNNSVGWDGTWLSSANITAGDWNNVTLTYDSVAGEIKLHVNGDAALTGSASALTGHNRATMGATREGSRYKPGSSFINSTSQHAYTGLIDEARVYKRALSDAEAAQLAAATPA
jgi:hypothetical protein